MLSPSFAKEKVLHLSAYCHSFRDWGRFCPNNCQTVLDDVMRIQVWRAHAFHCDRRFFCCFLWSLSRSHPTSPFAPLSALEFVAILSSFCGFGISHVVSSTSEQKNKNKKEKKTIVMLSVYALISYRPLLGRKAIVCSLQYLC